LFLDEPTSGLDSHNACSLIKLLTVLASRDSAVLCTIHQPSSEVFALFDIVIFMKAGRIFYQGPVSKINTYYADLDHPCPGNYNPADFVMNLCQSLSGDALERLYMPVPAERQLESASAKELAVVKVVFTPSSGFAKQLAQLTYREWVSTCRNPQALLTRYGVTIFLNILYGVVFWQIGDKDTAESSNFNAHVGMVCNALVATIMLNSQSAMLAYPFERPMFLREYSTGTCKALYHVCSSGCRAGLPLCGWNTVITRYNSSDV
jgi:hypothetical protein